MRIYFRGLLSFLFIASVIVDLSAQDQSQPSSLESGFKNPPVSARPKALWPWLNGNVNLSQITYEIEEVKRKGMGGFDIWDVGTQVDPNHVIPAGPAFLSNESLYSIAHTIREADRVGLELGLTFASSWNAGGSWVKPEHGAMGLFRSDTIVKGPSTFSAVIPFPEIPENYGGRKTILSKDPKTGLPVFYKNVTWLAHPVEKDSVITSDKTIVIKADPSGKITWNVPAGNWRIIRYVCAPTGQPLAIPSENSKGLMLDHFSAEAQRYNIEYIFRKLLPVTGSLKNRSLKYLYADSYEVNSAVWTPLLPEEFQKRNGYSLEKFLPALDGFNVESKETSERFLFDFRKTLSDLIIENHYRLGRELCEKEGLGFYAEAGGPGKPIHNVPFEDLKALGSLTVPRGEFWNKHPQLELLQIIKGISSASHIYNQKFVEAESFTSVWLWQEGPDQLKPLADRAMCEGLNRFVYHTFPHTPPESGDPGWVYNFGTLINTTNGWWPKSSGFHEYLARCSYLLQQGNFAGDVAFYYGDDAPNFVSPKHIPASLGFGYDYDVVNSEVILDKMTVKNGRIYLPHGQYYEALVLPNKKNINLKVLQKIEQLVSAGATVIGPKPATSVGLNNHQQNDQLVQSLSSKLWGGCDSVNVRENKYGKGNIVWGKSLRDVLVAKGVSPDISADGNSSGAIDFIHRKTEKEEIYFIRNTTNKQFTTNLTFRVKVLQPQLWNPENGEIISLPFYETTPGGIRIPFTLKGNESFFVVFKSSSQKASVAGLNFNGKVISGNSDAGIYYTSKGMVTSVGGDWKWSSGSRSVSKKIEIQKHKELEGPWQLHLEQGRGAPSRESMEKLIPLNKSSNEGVKHFSGSVTYHHTFTLTKNDIAKGQRLMLDLGVVKEIAGVFVNGKNLGIYWHTPYQIDITEAANEGENILVVEVVNTPNNRLVGDAKLPSQYQQTKSNVQKLPNAWMNPFASAPLIDAGLIGPVQIRFMQTLTE